MALENAISPAQWRKFFQLLSEGNTIQHACRVAKIAVATAYWQRKRDQSIADRWLEAEQAGTEFIEQAGINRAVKGVKRTKGIYWQGQLIDTEIEIKYSDSIWQSVMAARDPRYRQNTSDQIEVRMRQELSKLFDVLQKGLEPAIYAMVLDVLSQEQGIIDVQPLGILNDENNNANNET